MTREGRGNHSQAQQTSVCVLRPNDTRKKSPQLVMTMQVLANGRHVSWCTGLFIPGGEKKSDTAFVSEFPIFGLHFLIWSRVCIHDWQPVVSCVYSTDSSRVVGMHYASDAGDAIDFLPKSLPQVIHPEDGRECELIRQAKQSLFREKEPNSCSSKNFDDEMGHFIPSNNFWYKG